MRLGSNDAFLKRYDFEDGTYEIGINEDANPLDFQRRVTAYRVRGNCRIQVTNPKQLKKLQDQVLLAVVRNCPRCGGPVNTKYEHRIVIQKETRKQVEVARWNCHKYKRGS